MYNRRKILAQILKEKKERELVNSVVTLSKLFLSFCDTQPSPITHYYTTLVISLAKNICLHVTFYYRICSQYNNFSNIHSFSQIANRLVKRVSIFLSKFISSEQL